MTKLILRIEDDGDPWFLAERYQSFCQKLATVFLDYFSDVETVRVSSQKQVLQQKLSQYPNAVGVISLDPILSNLWITQKSVFLDGFTNKRFYDFAVSRVFTERLSPHKQFHQFLGYAPRPEAASFLQQIQQIPDGEYVLFDDDIYSGGTVRFVKNYLSSVDKRHIKIVDIFSLSPHTSHTTHNIHTEILDCRDFCVGAPFGGLVVSAYTQTHAQEITTTQTTHHIQNHIQNHHKTLRRIPYHDDRIALAERASIDPQKETRLKEAITSINRACGYQSNS